MVAVVVGIAAVALFDLEAEGVLSQSCLVTVPAMCYT
jgi:hypothetical protein